MDSNFVINIREAPWHTTIKKVYFVPRGTSGPITRPDWHPKQRFDVTQSLSRAEVCCFHPIGTQPSPLRKFNLFVCRRHLFRKANRFTGRKVCGELWCTFHFRFSLDKGFFFFLMAWVFPLRSSNKSNSVPTFRTNNWEQKSTNLARQTRVYIQNGSWWPHNTITQWTWHFISNYWKIGRLNFKLRDIFPKDQELVYTLVDT